MVIELKYFYSLISSLSLGFKKVMAISLGDLPLHQRLKGTIISYILLVKISVTFHKLGLCTSLKFFIGHLKNTGYEFRRGGKDVAKG